MRKNEEKGRNTGTDTTERNVMELFLEDVEAQIQYKPAARRISKELYDHLEDKTEEYKSEGLAEEEAMSCAVKDMGDAAALGVMMNDTHRVKLPWVFILSVVMAVLLGIAGNIAEYGSGDFSFEEKLFWIVGNSIYFPLGLLVFAAVLWKGYPWIVRYSNKVLAAAILLLSLMIVISELNYSALERWLGRIGFMATYMLSLPVIILTVPIMMVLAYKLRSYKTAGIIAIMCLFGIQFLSYSKSTGTVNFSYRLVAFAAFLISMIFMGVKKYFRISPQKAIPAIIIPGMLIAGLWGMENKEMLSDFSLQCFQPELHAKNAWDDSYNSILIKNLLPQAKLFGGLMLPEETLKDYYMADWYFDGKEDTEIPNRIYREEHWKYASKELTDILPQHYHNNYRIAYWILQYGWGPGIFLLLSVAAVYALMLKLILRIHNPMGKAISTACFICLAGQTVLYTAGNFGFQFGWFTTFPFISEGNVSIVMNMMLAGLIASSYSYDHAISEEEELKIFRPLRKKVTATD